MTNFIYRKSKNNIRRLLFSGAMTKEDLFTYLYTFQKIGEPMVPLYIEKSQLKSEILEDILLKDDCITNNENLVAIRQRCLTKINDSINLPSKINFGFENIYKGYQTKIFDETVKVTPLFSSETAKLTPLIPDTMDMGVLFTIPKQNQIFNLFLPLYQDTEETIIFELNEGFSNADAYEKYEVAYDFLNKYILDYIDNCDLNNTLYKFLNLVYPVSLCTFKEYCTNPLGERHENSPKKSENHLTNAKRLKNSRCYCGRRVAFGVTKLKSEKIKKDLENNVFMEWYASRRMKLCGLDSAFYNVNIKFDHSIDKHIDALAFNHEVLMIMECKSIYDENNQFFDAISKLKNDKRFFQDRFPNKYVYCGLMTNFHKEAGLPEQIDFHINHDNFFEFDNILRDLV